MGKDKKKVARIAVAGGVGALCVLGLILFGVSRHRQSGPPQNDMVIDKVARNEVIENVISNLNRFYVFPEKAAAMEKQLRTQVQHGDFDSITRADKFAEVLTDALQRDTHDKHLEVRYFEKAIPEQADQEDSEEDKVAELLHGQRFNFGFASVQRLHGDIGYIDLHQFSRPQQTADRIAAAMTLMSDTHALIIDLRMCGGGDPETVMLFANYLFDKPTHLNDIYWREDNRTEERWTQENVAGKKYGEARKIYVLTSADTFSAGEDFAYALKNAGRATLVGETTGGGAHPGRRRRLTDHFLMNVPSGRAINPVTHTDWETVGVTPDVNTPAKKALDVAQIAILKDLIAVETDPDWKDRLQASLSDLQ